MRAPASTSPATAYWTTTRCVAWGLAALLAFSIFGNKFRNTLIPPSKETIRDFYQEWSSARNLFTHLPIYASLDVSVPRHLGWTLDKNGRWAWEVNAHPPSSVLLGIPFAMLEYPRAFQAWTISSLLALALSIVLVTVQLRIPWSAWSILPTVTLLLTCGPLMHQMVQGQLNLVLLALLTGIWAADRGQRPALAGTLLGLATAIKLFPGFLFLHFLLRRQWRAFASGVVSFAGVCAVTALVLRPAAFQDYVTKVLPKVNEFRGAWLNASVSGFWNRLFDPGSAAAAGKVLPLAVSPFAARLASAACVLLLLGLWARALWKKTGDEPRDGLFGLSLCTMLLVSPVTWDHYLLLLLVPLAVGWFRGPPIGPARLSLVVIVAAMFVPAGFLIARFLPGGPQGKELATPLLSVTVLAVQLYATLGLFAWNLKWGLRAAQASEFALDSDADLGHEVQGLLASQPREATVPVAEPVFPKPRHAEPIAAASTPPDHATAWSDEFSLRRLQTLEDAMPTIDHAPGQPSRWMSFLALQAVILIGGLGWAGYRYGEIEQIRALPHANNKPLQVEPLYDEPLVASDEQLRQVLWRLRPQFRVERPNINFVDHALRFWGIQAKFNDQKSLSGEEMRKLLLDHQVFFKQWGSRARPLLIDDPSGGVKVRTQEGAATASHHDHTLAGMAEVGTPLDFPVITSQGARTYRQMLEQSLRDFSLNQVEYEWSVLAYALFLPPTREWVDGEGQLVNFDRFAERIMRQDLPQGVCLAHHRMHALVMLLRVHEQVPILEPETKTQIIAFLKNVTQVLVTHQHADGYWNRAWPGYDTQLDGQTSEDRDKVSTRILATGHPLEWWALAPSEVLPPREVVIRAGQWLCKTILELPEEQLQEGYGFCSHAGRALAMWRKRWPADVDLSGFSAKPK